MEKEYVVACPYEERSALLDAAEFLNGRMREIRDSGKVVGHDRIAVMVALNLAQRVPAEEPRGEVESSIVASAAACAPCASASKARSRRVSSSSSRLCSALRLR